MRIRVFWEVLVVNGLQHCEAALPIYLQG